MLVDGDLVLTESAAIVTYLGDKYGGLTPPVGGTERARYNEWTSFILMELDAHTLYVMRKHGDLAALYGEAPAAMQAARDGFDKQIRWAEGRLGGGAFRGRRHLLRRGHLLTSCLDWARAYGFVLSPALEAYRERHRQRPAYRSAAESELLDQAGRIGTCGSGLGHQCSAPQVRPYPPAPPSQSRMRGFSSRGYVWERSSISR